MQKITLLIIFYFFIISVASAQNNLTLWYNKPAEKWTDALPIGNGRLGGMIFGGVEREHIQFNEETLWSGKPRNVNDPNAHQYLAAIRKLLFEGKQKQAEDLAQKHFMGLQSEAGDIQQWIQEMSQFKGIDPNVIKVNFDDSKWKTLKVPAYDGWETVGLANLDGAVWFRTSIEISDELIKQDLVLDLNRIYNADFTYLNGQLIGQSNHLEPRTYQIPKALLKVGQNVIAIQVLNPSGKGGILGFKDASRAIGIYPKGKSVKEGVSLNGHWKYKIQSTKTPAVAEYQASYQPFGAVYFDFQKGDVSNYKRSLDISNAIATTTYQQKGINFTRTYFASAPHRSIVIHFTADQANALNLDASFGSVHLSHAIKKVDQKTIALNVQVKDGALRGEARLTAEIRKGTVQVIGNKIQVSKASEVTFYLTASTNFINADDVTGNPAAVNLRSIALRKNKDYRTLKAAHIQDYQSYFNTFKISLGQSKYLNLPTDERLAQFSKTLDPSFISLFTQYGRYLLISSSREGTQPANLQGIWNDLLSPPWGSKYTTNINYQMNYWPSDVLNLSRLFEPFTSKATQLQQKGEQTAKAYYKANGWILHHNTDIWNATAPINASNHGIWQGGSAWIANQLWDHYLYTGDKNWLSTKAYPVIASATAFYLDNLVKDPKSGWLISSPSNSPENGGLVAGPTMDHQLIRTLFRNQNAADAVLGKKTNTKLAAALKELVPNQIGQYGQLQEWLTDIDDTTNKHRHVSHLWGVYPGNDITWQESKMMNAAKQSLLYRGDDATGWSLAWKINFWARFKDGDHAMELIKLLLKPSTSGAGLYNNLFDAHPPFQIDGNFGAPAGIAEMLVQSHQGFIDILPALPSVLSTGQVKGIKARGAFILDLEWKDGQLVDLKLISEKGNPCTIKYLDKEINLETKPGQNYHLDGKLNKI